MHLRVMGWIAAAATALLVLPPATLAQETGTVTGAVTDVSSGQPLSQAQVFIEGTGIGSLTNQEGRYLLLNVPVGPHDVSVTRLGYGTVTQSVDVQSGEATVADFRLEETAITLDEIVVTGYESRIRADVSTGSVSDIGEIDFLPIQTADQALQGRSSGVQVGATSGQPGSGMEVRVRGIGSIDAGNDPLYIIDGVQMSTTREQGGVVSTSPLASLNPADIESIEILKDAAATSIYGAQAANGVVLISTKRGEEGPTQWTMSAEYGRVESMRTWDVLDGPQWVELQMEAFGNRSEDLGQPRSAGEQQAIDLFGSPAEVGTYDWQDEVLRSGQIRRYDLSARGGSADTRFYISAGHSRQDAQLKRSFFERTSFRANLENQSTERLSILVNLGVTQSTQEGDLDGNCQNCSFWSAPHMRPTIPIYNEDGSFNRDIAPIPYNMALQVYTEEREATTRQALGSVTANYSITPRLNFRSLWGMDFRTRREHRYRPPELQVVGDDLDEVYREVTNWNTNQVLQYTATIGSAHNLTALAGAEYRSEAAEVLTAEGQGLPSGLFSTLDLAAVPQSVGGETGGFKVASGFSRVQYDYLGRYFLSASLRYDGSSRFGSDFQWGLFYSGSVGWELAREEFMQGFESLDELRLRASYGVTGNSDIGDFAALTLFGRGLLTGTNQEANSYRGTAGLRPTQLGNNRLTWEEARTFNVGLTWAALGNRIYGSVDLFRTNNESLLLDAFLTNDSGFESITQNSGVVRNQGIELEIGGVPVQGSDFSWTTDFNISYLDNEIIELVGGLENIGSDIRVGHPLLIHWGPRWAGVNPADGRPMWYDQDGNITYQARTADNQVLGSPIPEFEGGWNNRIRYRGLELDAFVMFSLGHEVEDTQLNDLLDVSATRGLSDRILTRRWRQPGDMVSVPKSYTSTAYPSTGDWDDFSSRFLYDGSYVRLKSVTVGYQLPADLAGQVGLTAGRVYVQGRNLWTGTAFPGIDPEIMAASSNTFPNSEQFLFGIELHP